MGKLDTGDWPSVGGSNADELVRVAERQQLTKQRELLEETLAEVNEKITKLEAGLSPEAMEAEAEAQAEAEAAPTSESDTTPEFTPSDVVEEMTETPAEEAAEPEPALAP